VLHLLSDCMLLRYDFGVSVFPEREDWDNVPSKQEAVIQYTYGSNGVVVSIADCYPKGAGFDSRVMLGIFP
jgi:hypothetical protein